MVVRAESGGCERARGAVSTREQSARVCIKFVLNVLVRTLKGHVTAGAQGYILGQRGARWAGDVSRSPGNPVRSLSSQIDNGLYFAGSYGLIQRQFAEDQTETKCFSPLHLSLAGAGAKADAKHSPEGSRLRERSSSDRINRSVWR